ncbi:MAG: ARMT1-like domain-containing protein [Anaerolineae bacterium]|nr:ARMT1-like domain-containing protein [Anaerolineae bacterium]
MKTYYECYPCFLRQALKAAQLSGASDQQQFEVLQKTLTLLQDFNPDARPPEIGYRVHKNVRDVVGDLDPYQKEKLAHTRQALDLYPKLKELVSQSVDPLEMAIRISIAGNIIDLAMKDHFDDLWLTVERVIQQPYAINHGQRLIESLKKSDWVLYLADNAGETVFDRVLIETLAMPVVYAVKHAPIVNDALMSDALLSGLDECTTLISNGSQALGTVLSLKLIMKRSAMPVKKYSVFYKPNAR